MSSSKKYSRWAEEEEAFLIANYQTMTVKEIAKRIGRTESSVSKRVLKIRLKKRNTRKVIEFIKENYEKLSYKAMAETLGISKQTVWYHVRKLGYSNTVMNKRNKEIFNSYHNKKRQSEEAEAQKINRLIEPFNGKESIRALYKRFKSQLNVSAMTFGRILKESGFQPFNSQNGQKAKLYLDGNPLTPDASNVQTITSKEWQKIYTLNGQKKSTNTEMTEALLELARLSILIKEKSRHCNDGKENITN